MQTNHYAALINRVTTYVSENLRGDLSLATLADIAGFSQFHFHRIFKSVTGESINAFVVRRRTERAIGLMRAARRISLTNVALDCGFSALSDFSRVFKQLYGLAPSAWDRRSPLQISKIRQAPNALPIYTDRELQTLGARGEFIVKIRKLSTQKIAYIRLSNAYANIDQLIQAYRELPQWVCARGQAGILIGMSEDDPEITPPERYRYDVCMTVPENVESDGVMSMRALPACTIASIHCVGDIVQVDRTWQYLYRHWLPNSGYLPDNLPAMEIYVRTPEEIGWETFDLECAIAITPLI